MFAQQTLSAKEHRRRGRPWRSEAESAVGRSKTIDAPRVDVI